MLNLDEPDKLRVTGDGYLSHVVRACNGLPIAKDLFIVSLGGSEKWMNRQGPLTRPWISDYWVDYTAWVTL